MRRSRKTSGIDRGALIRSAGGWRAIRAAFEGGIRLVNDERILGSSSFVEKTLAELSGPSRRQQISQARALISYLAVRELRISGADVARRMNIDRSSVSRAVGRVQADPALTIMRNALLCHLYPEG